MKNKIVGIIIVVIALIIGFITWSFNKTLTNIINISCPHGPSCPMYGSIAFQTNMSLGLTIFILLIGLYLIFFGQEKVEIIKKIRGKVKAEEKAKKKDYSKVMSTLSVEERKLLQFIIDSQGAIFQSELIEKSGFDKVKVSRLLDRLEGQGLIERRRRGMTNVIILKT